MNENENTSQEWRGKQFEPRSAVMRMPRDIVARLRNVKCSQLEFLEWSVMPIRILKSHEDATEEAARLNQLNGEHEYYYVVHTRVEIP